MSEKEEFIRKYLDKKMKGYKILHGVVELLNIINKNQCSAEQAWRVKMQRVANKCNPKKRTK